MKYGRAFLKLCMVLTLVIGLGTSVAWSKRASPPAEDKQPPVQEPSSGSSSLKCNPKNADNKCNPVMEAWCYQNAEVIQKAAKALKEDEKQVEKIKKYQNRADFNYVPVDCTNSLCCITRGETIHDDSMPDPFALNTSSATMPYFLKAMVDKTHASMDCWLCPLLEDVFVTGNSFASLLYRQISRAMLALLGVFASLTLMWMVFKVFVDFSGKESRAFVKKAFFLCVRVAIIAILLVQSPRVVGDLFFTPFVRLSMGISLDLMAATDQANHAHIAYLREHFTQKDNILGCTHHDEFFEEDEKNGSELMFDKITCGSLVGLVQIMSIELSTPVQYGQALMSYSFDEDDKAWQIMPNFKIFFTGLAMLVAFVILLVVIPFKVVDVFVQWSVLCTLSPLAITLFAFPATRSYTKGVWKMFISCLIQMIVLSLMVALSVAFFTGRMDDDALELFLKNETQKAYERLGLGDIGFLAVVALGYLAYQLLDRATEFAQQLGGGLNLGLGSPMEKSTHTVTAKTAGTVAGVTAGPWIEKGTDAVKKGVDKGVDKTLRWTNKGLNRLLEKVRHW